MPITKRRRNLFITEEQNAFLESRNELTVSEHIRRAIDQYISKLKNNNSSESLSKTSLPKNCFSCFAPSGMSHAISCKKGESNESI